MDRFLEPALSVPPTSVLGMQDNGFTDRDQAVALVESAVSAVRSLRDGHFWKLQPEAILAVGQQMETLSRVIYAAQVHLAGELDTRGIAKPRGCFSTAALLRQAFNISPAEANGRVNTARKMLDSEGTGGDPIPAQLPALGSAVDSGRLAPEHVKIIVQTMSKLPAKLPDEDRGFWEEFLVEKAELLDPTRFEKVARKVLDCADPDGELDDSTPASKMEFSFGGRNIRTGLTPIKGQLDDHGVEVVKKALDALAAPRPQTDGTQDVRPATNRYAHALVTALRGFLDAGTGPMQGGERPHLTVIMNWDLVSGVISNASFESGGPLSPAQSRRFLCDAEVIPAILGSDGEVLDVGRKSRTFPVGIRRAITLRDGGCVWDGCDRPAGWCDGHHVRFWQRDFGSTSYDNGVLLCPFHHTEIHKGEWKIRMAPDGIPELIPPKWLDHRQRPRRNVMHRLPMPASG